MDANKRRLLYEGAFIPAHPLALFENRTLDEASQRRLTRYYIESGVDGLAIGVHTTQFELHDDLTLYQRVLQLAMEEANYTSKPLLMIAGITGPTEQAVTEAKIASELGYDAVLLSNYPLSTWTEEQLIERAKAIGDILPIVGFYLQPAVGGRVLSRSYWKQLAEIPSLVAIKFAPFDRYLTLDAIHAVMESDRWEDIAFYTGNDDQIIFDLLSSYSWEYEGEQREKHMVGGLLGHWSVWTSESVHMFHRLKKVRASGHIPQDIIQLAHETTDANAAFFDSRNGFKGSIAGIHKVLYRQGLLRGTWCLADHEVLSPGQSEEIDAVYDRYSHLADDQFVREFLEKQTERV